MMRKYFQYLFLILAAAGFVLGSVYIKESRILSPSSDSNVAKDPEVKKVNVIIGEVVVPSEIADTDQSRELGLSYRKQLDAKSGMLFSFNSLIKPVFWMKDMLFPLDIIWIREDKIVDIHENVPVPEPSASLNQLPKYSPKEAVNYVLEVNAGFSKKNDIKVGNVVEIKY